MDVDAAVDGDGNDSDGDMPSSNVMVYHIIACHLSTNMNTNKYENS